MRKGLKFHAMIFHGRRTVCWGRHIPWAWTCLPLYGKPEGVTDCEVALLEQRKIDTVNLMMVTDVGSWKPMTT